MFFKNLCILALWTKVASAMKELKDRFLWKGLQIMTGRRRTLFSFAERVEESDDEIKENGKVEREAAPKLHMTAEPK